MENDQPAIKWDDDVKECYYSFRRSKVGYPCLNFIKERLDLFEKYGIGGFVWEGGQGLQYFYELF
jgi:hypothetical protein